MKSIFNKSMALILGLALFSNTASAVVDLKGAKDAIIVVAQYLKGTADATKDANAIKQAADGLKAAQAGDLGIPKPAKAPTAEQQKSIDSALLAYQNVLVACAAAIKASTAKPADAGLKTARDLALGKVGGAEKNLESTIASIK